MDIIPQLLFGFLTFMLFGTYFVGLIITAILLIIGLIFVYKKFISAYAFAMMLIAYCILASILGAYLFDNFFRLNLPW